MAVVQVVSFEVVCDRCKNPSGLRAQRPDRAISMAWSQQWTVRDQRHLCPICTPQESPQESERLQFKEGKP